MKSIMPGDLMFTWNESSPLAHSIHQKTNIKISHVQPVLDVGVSGTLYVMSAEASGLTPKWVIPETLDWQCVLTCPDWTLKMRDKYCQWMWDHKDIPYDFLGLVSFVVNIDLNNESRLFCSEQCYQGAIEALDYYFVDGIDHAYVSPGILYTTPVNKMRDGSKKEVR